MESAAASTVPGLLVRFRPTTPWRFGPDSGARDLVDVICHSDTLFSAVSAAMGQLGWLDEWLAATARSPEGPAVRFSSGYPFQGELLYIVPPRNLWPPPASAKVRWKGARFVPVSVVTALLAEQTLEEERWRVEGRSESLIPARGPIGAGPFRPALRSAAAVDRLAGSRLEPHVTACLEFTPGAGVWFAAAFSDEPARQRWLAPLTAALRLLADSGLGGERSRGWGRSEPPEIVEGALPDLLLTLPEPPRPPEGEQAPPQPPPETAYWLLSLFNPAPQDTVDWGRGNYAVVTREGRIESRLRSGDLKKPLRMVTEGSVLLAGQPPRGAIRDVAPDGFPHPVYRCGFALCIPIPWRTVP